MYIDTYLEKGSSHKICEDYVMTSSVINPCGVISDGCSSSPLTDIGSRIIATNAVRMMNSLVDVVECHSAMQIASNTKQIAYLMDIPNESLDATLISLMVYQHVIKISAFGDGFVGVIYKDGTKSQYMLLSDNFPFYINYFNNNKRLSEWEKNHDTASVIIPMLDNKKELDIIEKNYYNASFCLNKQDIAAVIIASDGIFSFGDGSGYGEIIQDLMDFKSLKGEFVKKRMNGFKKKHPELSHYDDLSILGVSF